MIQNCRFSDLIRYQIDSELKIKTRIKFLKSVIYYWNKNTINRVNRADEKRLRRAKDLLAR